MRTMPVASLTAMIWSIDLTNVPIDQIIAVKEGAGIVPHPFPKIPSPK